MCATSSLRLLRMLFRSYGLRELAVLAWTVVLLHLAGRSLAKGAVSLTADGIQRSTATRAITPSGAGGDWVCGVGSLIAAMSLAAMPPPGGFVSEWFVFQSRSSLSSRPRFSSS